MELVFVRIALRYIAGFLVIREIIPADLADLIARDHDIAAMVGVAIAVAVEGVYAMAKRFGWAT